MSRRGLIARYGRGTEPRAHDAVAGSAVFGQDVGVDSGAPGLARDVGAAVLGLLAPSLSRHGWLRPSAGSDKDAGISSSAALGSPPIALVDSCFLGHGWPAVLSCLVEVGSRTVQVFVGLVEEGDRDSLAIVESLESASPTALIGRMELHGRAFLAYNALEDPLALSVLLRELVGHPLDVGTSRLVLDGDEVASVIADERFELRAYRQMDVPSRPEVELSIRLDEAGFNHIAAPLALWRRDGHDRVFVREYLPGASDGAALASTSLRGLFADGGEPAAAGGDFSSEAGRLGTTTARMHLASARAFGERPIGERPGSRHIIRRGATIRLHGDYRLDKVARTELGWYIRDFPLRGAGEAGELSYGAPLEDVASLFRSMRELAADVALDRQGQPLGWQVLKVLAIKWLERNERAFLDGYLDQKGIRHLLPRDARDALFAMVGKPDVSGGSVSRS